MANVQFGSSILGLGHWLSVFYIFLALSFTNIGPSHCNLSVNRSGCFHLHFLNGQFLALLSNLARRQAMSAKKTHESFKRLVIYGAHSVSSLHKPSSARVSSSQLCRRSHLTLPFDAMLEQLTLVIRSSK